MRILLIIIKAVSLLGVLLVGLMVTAQILIISKSMETNWETVEGIVKSVEVTESKRRRGTSWCPKVNYQYLINGVQYDSDLIKLTTPCSSGESGESGESGALSDIAEYKQGQVVSVYYTADEPEKGILKIGASWLDYLTLAASSLALIVFLLILFVKIPKRSKDEAR